VADDPLAATAHALAVMGVCGERAAEGSPGPGTFRVRFVDALHALAPQSLDRHAHVEALT
jgi:hydroxyethylthiazole kinase